MSAMRCDTTSEAKLKWLTDVYESVGPADITGRLVLHALGPKTIDRTTEYECDDRDRRSTVRRVSAAGFPRNKWIGGFDLDAKPSINAATIHSLATGDRMRRGDSLCLIGAPGPGRVPC